MRTRTSGARTFFGNNGGRKPSLSSEKINDLEMALRTTGLSRNKIAERYGISKATMYEYFDKFGRPTERARKALISSARRPATQCHDLDPEFDEGDF